MPVLSRLVIAGLLFSTLVCSACGGGGGGDTPGSDASLLNGPYLLWVFLAADRGSADDIAAAAWGPVLADGAGTINGMVSQNTSGVFDLPAPTGDVPYTVAGDRQTTIVIGGAGYAGWSNSAGTAALLGNVTSGKDPAIVALTRLGSGFSDASLLGDYHLCGLTLAVTGSTMAAMWGTTTFDGLGTGTMDLTGNAEGSIGTQGPLPLGYSVSANGELSLDINTTVPLGGAIDATGELVITAGAAAEGFDPYGIVLIPRATGASVATLSGTYQIVGLEREGGGFTAVTGSAVCDGEGGVIATMTRNTDGVITTPGSDASTYTVASDGSVVVSPGNDALFGAVSPSGAYAMLAGEATDGTTPAFYLLIRR